MCVVAVATVVRRQAEPVMYEVNGGRNCASHEERHEKNRGSLTDCMDES